MSVRKNLYLAFAQEYSVFIITFLTSIVMARLLTPNETGVYGLSYVLVAILMQLRQFGMGTYIVQSRELDTERAASALGVMYLISWTLGLIILFGSGLFANFFSEPRLANVLRLLSITFFLAPTYQFGMAMMERRMEFRNMLKLTVVATVVSSSVGIGTAYFGASYMSLPLSYVCYVLASMMMVWILKPAGNIHIPKLAKWREVVGFGTYTSGAGLVGTIGKWMPEVVLGKIAGVTTVGLYSRASSLTGILQTLIVNAITRTVNVSLAGKRRDGQALGPDYLTALGLATGLAWSAFALLSIVAKPLMYFLYGAQWVSAAPFLTFLCFYQMALLSLVAYSEMMTMHGAYKRLFFYELGLALFALLNFTYWTQIDVHYGAASRVLEGLAFFALYSWMLSSLLKINYLQMLPIYIKSALLAAVTCIPALAFSMWQNWPEKMSFIVLFALALVSGLFWLGGLFLVKHPLAPHVSQVLQHLAKRNPTEKI